MKKKKKKSNELHNVVYSQVISQCFLDENFFFAYYFEEIVILVEIFILCLQ